MNAQSAQLGQSSESSSPYETERVLPAESVKTTSESGEPSSDQYTQEPYQTSPLSSVESAGQLISVLGAIRLGRDEAVDAPSAVVGVLAGALGADPGRLVASAERARGHGRTASAGGHDWTSWITIEVNVAMGAGAVTCLPMTALGQRCEAGKAADGLLVMMEVTVEAGLVEVVWRVRVLALVVPVGVT